MLFRVDTTDSPDDWDALASITEPYAQAAEMLQSLVWQDAICTRLVAYYQPAENRRPIYRLEGWIRRHIRKCFWLRWHEPEGRERRLRRLGLRGRMLKVAQSSRGARHLAGTGSLQAALSNETLRRYGFLTPLDLAGY